MLGLQLLWGGPPNSVRRCWDFKQSLRCADPWYDAFLQQCRYGNLSHEAYNLLHGFPTAAPVTISDAATQIAHGNSEEDALVQRMTRAARESPLPKTQQTAKPHSMLRGCSDS